jgi:hypothetical protein
MSERLACTLMGLGPSTHRYRARKAVRDVALRTRLKELIAKRMNIGDRRRCGEKQRRPTTSGCIGCIRRKDWQCGFGIDGGSAGMVP